MWQNKMDKYEINLTYDRPIDVHGLTVYPITLDKYVEFMLGVGCFLLDKNSIPDIRIISMSYLEYLIDLHKQGSEIFLTMLDYVLRLVLHKPDDCRILFGIDEKTKRGSFVIDGVSYGNDVFDELKNIICFQNLVELPDENIQKEIRDKMEEARKLRRRLSNSKPASFEDQMICVMLVTGLKMEDVYNLTIRKFSKILERADAKLHYEVYLSAGMNGMIDSKNKSLIKHWLTNLDDGDKNSDVIVEMGNLTNKISLEDKKAPSKRK